MIASVHLAVGAMSANVGRGYLPVGFGKKSGFATAFSAGLISHIILDTFPHWEYANDWPWPLVIVETLVVCCLVLSSENGWATNLVLVGGMAGAAFPDLLTRFSAEPALFLHYLLHLSHGGLEITVPLMPLSIQLLIGLTSIIIVKLKAP